MLLLWLGFYEWGIFSFPLPYPGASPLRGNSEREIVVVFQKLFYTFLRLLENIRTSCWVQLYSMYDQYYTLGSYVDAIERYCLPRFNKNQKNRTKAKMRHTESISHRIVFFRKKFPCCWMCKYGEWFFKKINCGCYSSFEINCGFICPITDRSLLKKRNNSAIIHGILKE